MTTAPWAAHFGLARTPFGKKIAARDLFARQAHAEAIARISFCVVESALGVITGDVGAGKTVALRAAAAALDPTRHQVIYIANPAFGTRGLYVTIVRALGAQPRYLKAELMAQASDLLAAEAAERHRRVVVICDEAHLLQPDQLEELRLLTNAEMDSASPFAGILAGQPTLNRQLRMGMFAALTSGSPPGSRSSRWTSPNQPPTCAITCNWRGAMSRCSPMMRSPGCTASPAGCPAPSTTPPPPRSSRPPPTARTSSTTPAPKKPSPSSPGTDHARPDGTPPPAPPLATPASPALAARARQLAAQAEHRRAIAEYRARHAADRQARVNALLLEAIAVLASLLGAPAPPGTCQPGQAEPRQP
jgi:energy-coupling factor transporter ATP-binding protein EcfA2